MFCRHFCFYPQASSDMFVLVCSWDAGHLLNGWRHGHGLQATARAMAKRLYYPKYMFLVCSETAQQKYLLMVNWIKQFIMKSYPSSYLLNFRYTMTDWSTPFWNSSISHGALRSVRPFFPNNSLGELNGGSEMASMQRTRGTGHKYLLRAARGSSHFHN